MNQIDKNLFLKVIPQSNLMSTWAIQKTRIHGMFNRKVFDKSTKLDKRKFEDTMRFWVMNLDQTKASLEY